jgi:hypothetical protein
MGFDWMILGFAASFLMVGCGALGGIFVVWAWADVVDSKWRANKKWNIPTALYPFTISIVLDWVAFTYLDSAAVRHVPEEQVTVFLFLFVFANFAFLFVTAVMVRRNSGPGTRLIAVGSKILVVVSIVCLVVMILGIPGFLKY